MKSLADIREEFIKTAIAHDIGRSEEDFHTYLRHQGLEHHLSETQIQDRNRKSNQLNSYGLALAIPAVLAYGALKMPRGLSSIFEKPLAIEDTPSIQPFIGREEVIEYGGSLSGRNIRPMPTADPHITSDYGLFPPL